jgi:phosphoesterase RecJ-like protein
VNAEFEQFRSFAAASAKIVLTTHLNPDADGIGCELALASYLRGKGKQVTILNHSETPDNLKFLDPLGLILHFDAQRHAGLISGADLLCVLDTNHPDRLGGLKPHVIESKARKVCIDHHLEPAEFADLYILDELSTATGEMLYRIFCSLDGNSLSREIAVPLYAAIMTDTGSFRYPKTDPEVHRVVAHLIECGADPVEIYQNIYDQGTPGRLRLLGRMLAELQTDSDGRIAYLTLTRQMFSETGTAESETDAFVSYALAIHGVQIGLLFTELDRETVKISLRSKGDIWINKLAKEFGGNGHKHAAGARVHNATLSDTIPKVLTNTRKHLL